MDQRKLTLKDRLTSLFEFAAKTRSICISLVMMVCLVASLIAVQKANRFESLDSKFSLEEIKDNLKNMNRKARRVHICATIFLDTGFPIATAIFLAGVIYRFSPPRIAFYLACLPICGMLLDLTENVMVVAALLGFDAIVTLMWGVTFVKFVTVFSALILAVGLSSLEAFQWLLRKLRNNSKA